MRSAHLSISAAAFVLCLGCAHTTGAGHVRVRVVEPTVVYTRTDSTVRLHATVVIANAASSRMDLAYNSCRLQLEKQSPSGWQSVLQTVCFQFGASDTIAPGDSITRSLSLAGALVSGMGPRFNMIDSIPGVYRLALDFRFVGPSGELITDVDRQEASSNPFRVRSTP
jgi:hypothetical protein